MLALQKKWVAGILEMANHVTLRPDYQITIWKEWTRKPSDETMLSVISTIIQPDYPTETNLMNNPDFLKIPFKNENSNLMKPMLNFFAGRASLSFAVRTFTKELIDLHDEPRRSKMAKQLIAFACKHFDDLEDDKDVIMYLLKLSDHIKDYSILTTINAIHVNQRTRFSKEQLPIKKDWVSDPVALEFISAKRRPGRKEKVAGTFSKISSLVTGTTHKRKIDSMQFIDHLALALQSDSVGLALDRTFETYHLSAVLRQALKPFLEQLITALYPEPKDRSESVCRMLIGYALSTLSLNPLLVQSPAMALMKSDKHWHFMKEKVGQELEAIDRISATTLQYAPRIANLIQVDTIVQLILEAWEDPDREEALLQSFRSKLGLLDVPAQQLARASMKAGLIWKMSSTSSTNAGAEDDPEANLGQLKSLIWDELKPLEKRTMITASLAKNLLTSELNLIDVYQDLVSQQIDLIRDAFKRETGTDANHSSSIVSASEDGVEQKETEKENEKS
jgi:hypothetical protein